MLAGILGDKGVDVQNGLLLRTDVHRLYGGGLVTVTPDLEFLVSDRVREEWHNGRQYYALRGTRLRPTRNPRHAPSRDALTWHNEVVFQG